METITSYLKSYREPPHTCLLQSVPWQAVWESGRGVFPSIRFHSYFEKQVAIFQSLEYNLITNCQFGIGTQRKQVDGA